MNRYPRVFHDYPFDGWDWTELTIKWNVKSYDEKDGINEHNFQDYVGFLSKMVWDKRKEENVICRSGRAAIKDIKKYLEAMTSEEYDEWNGFGQKEIWKALIGITDDYTFYRYFWPLAEYAWN